jgi:hypothetical protein
MLKRLLLLGAVAGLLAAIASSTYNKIYLSSLGGDFSKIVSVPAIFGSNIFSCLIASLGYFFLYKRVSGKADMVFNLVFVIGSFASIVLPLGFQLPLTIENPELFPGLVTPMHFFPVLAWLTIRPMFLQSSSHIQGLVSQF